MNEKGKTFKAFTMKKSSEKCINQNWNRRSVHLIQTISAEKNSTTRFPARTLDCTERFEFSTRNRSSVYWLALSAIAYLGSRHSSTFVEIKIQSSLSATPSSDASRRVVRPSMFLGHVEPSVYFPLYFPIAPVSISDSGLDQKQPSAIQSEIGLLEAELMLNAFPHRLCQLLRR